MALIAAERITRKGLEKFAANHEVIEVDNLELREQALKAFTAALDGKIANLQVGERLMILYEFHIILPNGKIRGGSGADRNMPQYIEWRKSVFERDGYACQDCGSKDRINAHHIKTWSGHPELRFDVDNGKTVCFECHKKYHPHIGFFDT